MSDCIFCKIGSGEIPSHKVYEDDNTLAFLDVKPHTKGHTVVIPKKHAVTIFDINDDKMKELILATKKAAQKIFDVLAPDGFNIGWNHNTAGGQVVPHLHIHIMPRWNNDGGGSMHSIVNSPSNVEEVAKLFI